MASSTSHTTAELSQLLIEFTGESFVADLLLSVLDGLPYALSLSTAVRDEHGRAVDMRVQYMNRLAYAGLPDPDLDFTGGLAGELWPGLIENGALQQCMAVLDTGIPAAGEFNWTEEGTYKPADYEYNAFRVGDDVLVWVLRDSTERLQAAWAMARSNSDLQAFAHVVAHDLKNPLTTISGFADLLGRTGEHCLSPTAQECVSHIKSGTARMRSLIDEVLSYSEAVALEKPSRPTIDLADIGAQVLDDLNGQIVEANAEVSADLSVLAPIGEVELRQLLQNLLTNALKFAQTETRPIIRLSAALNVDGSAEIIVADNGPGVPPDKRDSVFALFTRLDETADKPGTGIGLATCARIVERLGGRIWVDDDEILEGAAFHVLIPASIGPDDSL